MMRMLGQLAAIAMQAGPTPAESRQGTPAICDVDAELAWWQANLEEAELQRRHTPPSRQRERDARGGDHEVEELALQTAQVSTATFHRIADTVAAARATIHALTRRVVELERQLAEAEGRDVTHSEEPSTVRQLSSAPRLRQPA